MYCLLCTGHRFSQLIYCLLFLKTVNRQHKNNSTKKKQYHRSPLVLVLSVLILASYVIRHTSYLIVIVIDNSHRYHSHYSHSHYTLCSSKVKVNRSRSQFKLAWNLETIYFTIYPCVHTMYIHRSRIRIRSRSIPPCILYTYTLYFYLLVLVF